MAPDPVYRNKINELKCRLLRGVSIDKLAAANTQAVMQIAIDTWYGLGEAFTREAADILYQCIIKTEADKIELDEGLLSNIAVIMIKSKFGEDRTIKVTGLSYGQVFSLSALIRHSDPTVEHINKILFKTDVIFDVKPPSPQSTSASVLSKHGHFSSGSSSASSSGFSSSPSSGSSSSLSSTSII